MRFELHPRAYCHLVWCSAAMLVACSDSVSDPLRSGNADVPATVEAHAGNGQAGIIGQSLVVAPAVRVRNTSGSPLAGVTVRFVVTAGSGAVAVDSAFTDADGIASSSWSLGPLPGLNRLTATVDALPSVVFTANAESAYNIVVRYIGNTSARQRQVVDSAVGRWRSVILSELSDVTLTATNGRCFSGQPPINETIDDLLLFVEFGSIDGTGKILGQAGPCYIRDDNSLPLVGYLRLDAADAARIDSVGAFQDLVLHEIGHILGFGTIWNDLRLLTGAGGPNPRFLGTDAIFAYQQIGASDASVPVENTGAAGTRDGHWRESTFGNELMTGFLSSSANPLSTVTVGSLHDLGYTTNVAAASDFALSATTAASQALDVHGGETILAPRYRVDRRGLPIEIDSR